MPHEATQEKDDDITSSEEELETKQATRSERMCTIIFEGKHQWEEMMEKADKLGINFRNPQATKREGFKIYKKK